MNLCNTNHLRVTVNDALPFGLPTRLTYYTSQDHGRGREYNWSLVVGRVWLSVKLRPHGKRPPWESSRKYT